jgi:hypothetical protein
MATIQALHGTAGTSMPVAGLTTSADSASAAARVPRPATRRGYILAAAVLLVMMAAGTLPIPLGVLYQEQMGFGPLGVTVVFAAAAATRHTGRCIQGVDRGSQPERGQRGRHRASRSFR